MNKTIELLLCPFCGGKAVIYFDEHYIDYQKKKQVYSVQCTHCDVSTALYFSRENAINSWNTRVRT